MPINRKLRASGLLLAYSVFAAGVAVAQNDSSANNTKEQLRDGSTAPDIEEVLVIGTKQERYIVKSSDALTGIDLNFLENPRNITILPEQLILDRKITTLEEALRNVPGVTAADGFGGTTDDFFVRGFRRSAVFRNGFRRASIFKTNLTNIEYTQVVRGPASIRYGRVEPGGVVDVVTKKPYAEKRVAGELRYGSFDDLLALVDWSQPLTDDLAVRVVASSQDAESFRDFTDIKRDAIALSAYYQLSDNTRLDFGYEYRQESRPLDRGTVAIETPAGYEVINDLLDIPFSRRFGDPFEEFDVDFNFVEATLNHAFNETWVMRAGVAYENSTANDLQSRPAFVFISDADGFIDENGFIVGPVDINAVYDDPTDQVWLTKGVDGSRNRESTNVFFDFLINGEFKTGSITHRISIGGDYRDAEQDRQFVSGERADGRNNPLFNLQNPSYTLSGDFSLKGVPVDPFTGEDLGFYINTYSEITDRLGILLGLRYSETNSRFLFVARDIEQLDDADAVVPQAGLSYRLADNVALYGSYSESFEPNRSQVDGNGEILVFDPETGEQIEFGVKAEFFEGRAQAAVALFEIQKTNVIVGSDDEGLPIFAEGASSEGVELTFAGQPVVGMNVTASYAYIDAGTSEGETLRGVADQVFNVYASYEVQQGPLEGLGFGAGVFYEAERVVDDSLDIVLDDYTLVDASLWYTIAAPTALSEDGTIRFQLAVKNIFDEEYYGGATGGRLRIPLGAPRTAVGSVSFDF